MWEQFLLCFSLIVLLVVPYTNKDKYAGWAELNQSKKFNINILFAAAVKIQIPDGIVNMTKVRPNNYQKKI